MILHVEKNEDEELLVPTIWRPTLSRIVNSFKAGDFQLMGISNVDPLSPEKAELINRSIQYYGSALVSLPEESWETSVYIWMLDYWEVMVDLFTSSDGLSDLVLFARVFEAADGYRFKVQSVHVP
jgi:hypothetical protein